MTKQLQDLTWRVGALLCGALFLATSFRYSWTRDATDFRNYYTAAVLVRQSQPLRNYYDWSWFQGWLNKVGTPRLGSYVPQTPLAMMPLLPFSNFSMQTAKHCWLLLNLGFLGAIFWLLSRLTSLGIEKIALLTFLGYGSLYVNFLFGQYYVLLLLLITASLYFLDRRKEATSGVLLSTAFALKLYGAPFLLFLALQRRWKAVAAMLAAMACFWGLAIAIFNWDDVLYFGRHILYRALGGETIDPYHSLNNTLVTFLRRTLVLEPELNPHPLWNALWAFYFLRSFLPLVILILPTLAIIRSIDLKQGFAFFALAILLASPNMGSYAYVLALLPVVLLLDKASRGETVFLTVCYLLLGLPMSSSWSWFFPKLCLVLALFVFAAWRHRQFVQPAVAFGAVGCAALFAVASTRIQLAAESKEPQHNFEQIAVQRGAVFSSSPVVLNSGIAYQSMAADKGRYVLGWWHGKAAEEFAFDGHVLNPVAKSPEGPIGFELLAQGKSVSMLFDLKTRKLFPATPATSRPVPPLALTAEDLLSPDKQWIVSTKLSGGNTQLWLKNLVTDKSSLIAGGSCSSWSPAWELDSKSIVFASDCNRGVGCPALYRAPIESPFIARSF